MTGSFDHITPELLMKAYKHLADTFIEHQIRHMELIRESQEKFRALETMLADPEPVPANLEELVQAIDEVNNDVGEPGLHTGEQSDSPRTDDCSDTAGTDDGDSSRPAIDRPEGGSDPDQPEPARGGVEWFTPGSS